MILCLQLSATIVIVPALGTTAVIPVACGIPTSSITAVLFEIILRLVTKATYPFFLGIRGEEEGKKTDHPVFVRILPKSSDRNGSYEIVNYQFSVAVRRVYLHTVDSSLAEESKFVGNGLFGAVSLELAKDKTELIVNLYPTSPAIGVTMNNQA
ncbi:hypothetical protein BKA67DRAFT_533331 [Truncatella angustata]|uniref:Uncharacterized protein n=1 Tax=Truncatella angustata TaxID=152316 RepID=A0A9P9A2P5_9PEZI|nr:uncharacterized protein BKA67DRAFT_533331 [Truncatella angustata]KAH6658160.1 hypothetical protein BKA67DRAFT_533331 [Truncatella angustata]